MNIARDCDGMVVADSGWMAAADSGMRVELGRWLVVALVAQPQANSPCPENVVIQVGAGQGVIFASEKAFVGGYGTAVEEYWTPTTEDVLKAEAGLARFLAGSAPTLAVKYSSYTRQYTGFVLEGRRRIFMNFLCWPPETPGWQCSSVAVLDGGDCYFHLDYDVTKGEYSHLSVNGAA